MNEIEARAWIEQRWGADRLAALDRYRELLIGENDRQNLIARSTISSIWVRHLMDSAQLVALVDDKADGGSWVDIGSGAGLPGIVAAILTPRPVIMVEPRRRRVEFLAQVIEDLKLNASVEQSTIQSSKARSATVISARAVGGLDSLLNWAHGISDSKTIWVLPKGRSAESELVDARQNWHGVFHVEQSLTDSEARIVVAHGINRK